MSAKEVDALMFSFAWFDSMTPQSTQIAMIGKVQSIRTLHMTTMLLRMMPPRRVNACRRQGKVTATIARPRAAASWVTERSVPCPPTMSSPKDNAFAALDAKRIKFKA
jgi:hypothetical protein